MGAGGGGACHRHNAAVAEVPMDGPTAGAKTEHVQQEAGGRGNRLNMQTTYIKGCVGRLQKVR